MYDLRTGISTFNLSFHRWQRLYYRQNFHKAGQPSFPGLNWADTGTGNKTDKNIRIIGIDIFMYIDFIIIKVSKSNVVTKSFYS